MRINLSLLISTLIVVFIVTAAFALVQTLEERSRQKDFLYEKLSENAREIARNSLNDPSVNPEQLKKLCDTLTLQYNLSGMVLLLTGNRIISSDKDLLPILSELPETGNSSVNDSHGSGSIVRAGKKVLYQYINIINGKNPGIKAMVLYADGSAIEKSLRNIWIKDFSKVFLQLSIILLATFFLIRWGIFRPINSIVSWIKAIGEGKTDVLHKGSSVRFLSPLQKEVEHIASVMREARAIAEEEARLRTANEAIWTPDRLREEVKKILPGKTLVVVSNREPYMHVRDGKEIKCIVPASGMVTALEPILKACGGLWIATASGNADRETVNSHDKIAVPPGEEKYTLRRIWISEKEEQHFYSGFSNEGLWPLCHLVHTRPVFREEDWKYYREVNLKFAKVVLEEIRDIEEPFILVQDYHFALLPEMIKKERPDTTVGIFWHIPWPNPEAFGICPWKNHILKGMLGADLVGFHTQYHCNNFLETVNRNIDSRVKWENFSVEIGNNKTSVKSFPISIEFTFRDFNLSEDKSAEIRDLLSPFNLNARFMGIGVERVDYTKGIVERFHAVEYFLEKNPGYIGKFTFVQIGSPSRTTLKSYTDTIAMVESEAARINLKFKAKDWKPVLLLLRHHSKEEIAPFYKAANLCMVTSLHDGMNLVAKEFVASRTKNNGVLILSQFAGASHELDGALVVNPYDIKEMADAIKAAIEMPEKNQTQRMLKMRNYIMEHNIFLWAAELLRTMVSVQK